MNLESILRQILLEHKAVEEMLSESIEIILEHDLADEINLNESTKDKLKSFLKNYVKLVSAHFEFEETKFFPILLEEYKDIISEFEREHKAALELANKIMECVELGDFTCTRRLLEELHKLKKEHTRRENQLVQKMMKSKS